MSQKFKSEVELQALNNATTDTDKILVSDGGVIKYRTGAEVLSDIGGQSALTNPITGTGTTNYLPKFTGTTLLGNSQIFDNGTNVGIGTTSPSYKLHVNGYVWGSTIYANLFSVGNEGKVVSTSTLGLQLQATSASKPITFFTNVGGNTERMRISHDGNVGIGTTSPASKLSINHTSNTISTLNLTQNVTFTNTIIRPVNLNLSSTGTTTAGFGSGINFGLKIGSGNVENVAQLDVINNKNFRSGEFSFKVSQGSTPVEAVRINYLGNVGIGTTSPSSKLQVNGDLTVGDDSTVGSFINVIAAGASQDAGIRFGSESNTDLRAAIYTNTTTSDLHFDVTETTRMLINSATGNVGIGTTSPDTKLDIQASGTTQTSILGRGLDSNFRLTTRQDVSTNTDGSVIGEIGIDYITTRNTAVRFHRGGSTTGGFISFTTNDGSEKMRVTPTGNIGIGTTTPSYPLHVSGSVSNISIYATNDIVAFSDQSVKTNIRPIENALERVVQSRGVLYDRTDSKNKDNIGFIAQELEVAFPELVVTNEDGTKAVKYQNTVAVLFEAIKEQQKQIEELKQIVNGFTK